MIKARVQLFPNDLQANRPPPSSQNELPCRNVIQADNPIISPVGVIDVIRRVPRLQNKAAHLKESMKNEIITNLRHARDEGTDHPEIGNWTWPGRCGPLSRFACNRADVKVSGNG